MSEKQNALGLRIRFLREQRGLSQVELSKRTKIARTVITMIESGQRYPSEETLKKIIDELGVNIENVDTPEVRAQAAEQFKKASESFAEKASTHEIIKAYRKISRDGN